MGCPVEQIEIKLADVVEHGDQPAFDAQVEWQGRRGLSEKYRDAQHRTLAVRKKG